MKVQMSNFVDMNSNIIKSSPEIIQPSVLLVGTSNIEGIKEEKLPNAAIVNKVIKYTLRHRIMCINNGITTYSGCASFFNKLS